MSGQETPAPEPKVVVASTALPSAARQTIYVYLGVLLILLAFGGPHGGLIDIPISFLLKNKLHLEAHDLANFRLISAIPLYLSFVFGFIRDSWSPFGMHDRGYMLVFGATTAALYVCFAFMPVTYGMLLLAVVLVTISFLFVASAQNGLASTIGQQHAMTGRVSTLWNVFGSLPGVAALLIGGSVSDILESGSIDRAGRALFLSGAVIMAAVTAYALWKPKSVFDNIYSETATRPLDDIKRLVRHWPIYPALLIWLLWNFAPGSVTPLQYHLQNSLHATDAAWGQWNAIFSVSFVPTFLLFGYLCQRLPLRTLLIWGTVAAIPQMIPLLFTNSVASVLMAAVPMGLMGGVASAAYLDLIIRSCPKGLQGTTLMMSSSLLVVISRFGDVLGTNLYDHYGNFSICVIAITLVYALILPTLLLVPKHLIAAADGEVLVSEGERES